MIPVEEGRRLLAEAKAAEARPERTGGVFGTHENFRVYAWLYSHAAALLEAAERAETAEQDLYIVRATLGRYAEKVQDAEAALAEAAEQNQRYKEALERADEALGRLQAKVERLLTALAGYAE